MYSFCKFIANIIFRIFFRVRVHGDNKLPEGGMIICANHISALDPVMLSITCNRKIHYLGKKELFENGFLKAFLGSLGMIPIDRENLDIKAVKDSIAVLKDEEVLGIFPEGTRKKTVSEENVKSGIGLIASRAKTNIQPVYIESTYKIFSRVDIYYRDVIEIEDFLELEDKNKKIAIAVYDVIYDLERENTNESHSS